jgi:hypothetical protein
MKRSTWIAVSLTAAVLIAAGNLPRLRWDAVSLTRATVPTHSSTPVRSRGLGATSAVPIPARFAPPRLLVTPASHGQRPSLPIPPLPVLAAMLTAAMASLTLAIVWRLSSDRRGRVFQMARRGVSTTRIAGRTRVPQDAVRTLLTPGMGVRR